MREIKFRAWDTLHKTWVMPLSSAIVNYGDGDEITYSLNDRNGRLIFVFYTGLKDKNGKEIYEGDIIAESTVGKLIWENQAIVTERPVGEVIITPPYINILQIKAGATKLTDEANDSLRQLHDGSLHLTKYDGLFQWDRKDIEVIGNIYENPELLEVQK